MHSVLAFFSSSDSKTVPSKVCFVKFNELESVSTALHLTNTIFIDRALVITRSKYGEIPNEEHLVWHRQYRSGTLYSEHVNTDLMYLLYFAWVDQRN